MKKSLLALAAMGAFAGAAQAQSSVTVYGILDVGYIGQNYKQSGAASANTAAATLPNNTQAGGFASSAETTSRLGFRGSEDLGGGLRALFTIEMGLTPTNSSNISGNTTGFNNRQSFVGLAQKGIGMASIGTQYTPIHEAVGATDPGQQNNMPGNVIYPSDTNTNNTATNNGAATTGQFAARPTLLSGNGDGTVAYTVRSGNSIRFMSDRIAGFQGKLFYAQMNSNSTATSTTAAGVQTNAGGNINSGGWGVGLDYTWQKLLVTANIQQFKQQQFAGTITNNGSAQNTPLAYSGITWGTAGQNTADNQMYFGATYDFGILKAYAQYINRKVTATFDSNDYAKRTAQQIGVRGNLTKTIEGWASMGMGKVTQSYAVAGTPMPFQSTSANISGYQLGANYWLSKRTNLYGIFGVSSMSNMVYPTNAAGSTAASNAVSSNQSAYAVGVRHTF